MTTTGRPAPPGHDPTQMHAPDPVPDDGPTGHVAVVSTVHNGQDTRVLRRTTIALADAGHQVTYVTTDPPPPAALDGRAIDVAALDRPRSRLDRMTRIQWQALRRTLASGAEVVHLHDPELAPTAVALRLLRRGVVVDLHEDIAAQVVLKDWIPTAAKGIVARVVSGVERALPRLVDQVIAADPALAQRLLGRGATNVTLVENHPDLDEVGMTTAPRSPRRVVYVGGVTAARGLFTMIDALRQAPDAFELVIAGPFHDPQVERRAREAADGLPVTFPGWLDRAAVWELLSTSAMGLAVLDATPNYLEAQPTKVYEYLASGMEVVASDFPLWRRIFADTPQVHFVDPGDPSALAAAITTRLDDPPDEAARARLRSHVAQRWSWAAQRRALLGVEARALAAARTRRGTPAGRVG